MAVRPSVPSEQEIMCSFQRRKQGRDVAPSRCTMNAFVPEHRWDYLGGDQGLSRLLPTGPTRLVDEHCNV